MRIRANEWNALLAKVAALEMQVETLTAHASNGGEEPVVYQEEPEESGWGDLDQSAIDVLVGAGHTPDSVRQASDDELTNIVGIGPARLAKIRKALL